MTKEHLHLRLNSGRLSKNKILELVEELLHAPDLVGELLKAIWIEDKENTFNASWVFDHLMRKKLDFLLPFIDDFANGLENLESESCIRPMAHVCELLVLAKYKKKNPKYIRGLSSSVLEKIVSACFDWLIGTRKVAAKVFAMTSLLHLGTEFKWIHPELKPILENSISTGTVGYKNRAQKTLEELKKLGY
ncbi:adenylosuccinate lyase [uncultured Croceitalea sp.]|uniref:adenylosuccinate lyase n=1 Tax=uncultured Croceitalea sp. TaxID=1798908 RepID=UPI0033061791